MKGLNQVQGDIVLVLERLLASAKKGEIDGVAVVYVGPVASEGEIVAEDLAPVMFQLEHLKYSLLSSLDAKQKKKPRRLH